MANSVRGAENGQKAAGTGSWSARGGAAVVAPAPAWLRSLGRLLARADALANRLYGHRWNPLYHSGAIAVGLLLVLLVTGLYLLVFYRLGDPHGSVERITAQAWTGRWIRGLHRFASDAVLVAVAVHALRMLVQGRSWGPRALAWTSGVVLVGLLFVCGWTGYVMVWDTHAQLLAVEGARFLEVLPIFSEPIGRAFVGERPLPSGFFFLNLFAHVALPVGLALLVWIHVARVARPALLPPRGVLWGSIGLLTALAVLWPVSMAPPADPFRIPTGAPLDLFYAFWLPLTQRMPAWAVWATGAPLVLVALLAPWLTRPGPDRRPPRSVVNERLCTGCEQCVLDCPYDAIRMVERTDGRAGLAARVNPEVCVSCGICAGSCAPMGVGPAGRTGRDQLAGAQALLAERMPGSGEVVVVGCTHGAAGRLFTIPWEGGSLLELARAGGGGGPRPAARGGAPAGAVYLPIDCAGNLHTSVIELLVRSGTGGVLVASCPARDCRNREGVRWLRQRVYEGREAELKERVDRSRVRLVEAADGEPELLSAAIAAFRGDIAALEARLPEVSVELEAECEVEERVET